MAPTHIQATSRMTRARRCIALAGVLATTLLASSGTYAAAPDEYFAGRVGGVLGTPEQIARENQMLRIYKSEPVQRAIHELEDIMAKDSTALLPDARKSLKRAAEASGASAAMAAVNEDPDRPSAYWGPTVPPHRWGSLRIPVTGLMIDNPDNIYRTIPIDGADAYEIYGSVTRGATPAQQTFVLHEDRLPDATKEQVRNHQPEAGSVSLHDLQLGADGSFTITVDSSPANGRVNHLQTHSDVRDARILIRDTLADWTQNNPTQLAVRRVSGPPIRPARTDEELAARAAANTKAMGTYWLAWAHKVFYDLPVNTITQDQPRVSGWGRASCGHYRLAADEALVVRLERRNAVYLGFQMSDAWGQGQIWPYLVRTGSLNGSQARPNADGTYTYVIANSDPGVFNWLDTIGSSAGTFCIRWQKMPAGENAAGAVKSIGVVKTTNLRSILPAETVWVTPAQRARQLRERRTSFLRRMIY